MSVVTNLVIALMVVSNGVETVDAIRVQPYHQSSYWQTAYMYCVMDGAKVEKMEVKKSYTNFVLSSVIDMSRFEQYCIDANCLNYRKVSPSELLGKEPSTLMFSLDEQYYCPKHKCGNSAKRYAEGF